jgi:hypothetical protein
MNWKEHGRELWWPDLGYYSSIYPKILKKLRNLSQDSRNPCKDLEPDPLEYEARVLITRAPRSIDRT